MYAMLLLVLLADVARAGAVAPADASRGVIRGAPTHVRVSPEDGTFEVILARGNRRPIRFISQDRALAKELLTTYRAALSRSRGKEAGTSQAGVMRSLFERLCIESGPTLEALNFGDAGLAHDPSETAPWPALTILEHLGSPAP